MLSRATEVGLWASTPTETVTAIGAALAAHWVMAKAAATSQFARPRNWLEGPHRYLNDLYRVTTAR